MLEVLFAEVRDLLKLIAHLLSLGGVVLIIITFATCHQILVVKESLVLIFFLLDGFLVLTLLLKLLLLLKHKKLLLLFKRKFILVLLVMKLLLHHLLLELPLLLGLSSLRALLLFVSLTHQTTSTRSGD